MTPSVDVYTTAPHADSALAEGCVRRGVDACAALRWAVLRRVVRRPLGLLLVVVLGVGCGSLARPAPPPPPTPLNPPWDVGAFEDHLQFLVDPSRSDAEEQSPADLLAAYSAAQMEEAHLQPGLSGSFRVPYAAGTAVALQARVRTTSRKSVAALGEGSISPHEGSALGQRAVASVQLDGKPAAPSAAVLLRQDELAEGTLRRLAEAGTRVVFVEGEARAPATLRWTPTEGLMVVRVGPELREALQAGTDPGVGAVTLPVPWVVAVEPVATSPDVVNVLGYAPGKHPSLHRQLVIVCADLDPGVTDPLGATGAAAVLGTSQQVGRLTRLWALPERTILFALWSPGEQGVDGLAAYLADPLWSLDRTVSVVYVGLDPEREAQVQALLDEVDVPLRVLRADVADATQPAVAEADPVDRAAARAVRLARDVYAQVMAASLQPPPVPIREDSLGIPAVPRTPSLQTP